MIKKILLAFIAIIGLSISASAGDNKGQFIKYN